MSHYTRLTVIPVHEVVGSIGLSPNRPTIEVLGNTIKLFSLRLRTFATYGTTCCACGLESTIAAIEKHKNDKLSAYHLNLYGVVDGKEVMMTCDHVVARSKGGANNLTNTQTMCIICNTKKADK